MAKVLNKYKDVIPADAVYIGRGSIWGNPFVIGQDGTRLEVIRMYETYIDEHPTLKSKLHELSGKDLVCFCAPQKYHGDVLLKLANK